MTRGDMKQNLVTLAIDVMVVISSVMAIVVGTSRLVSTVQLKQQK
jgi:hypothetical protein